MKLVILLVGALVVVLAVILDNVNERNDWLGAKPTAIPLSSFSIISLLKPFIEVTHVFRSTNHVAQMTATIR